MDVIEVVKAARLQKHMAMVRERESSGKTVTEWCKEHGVGRSRYYFWQRAVTEATRQVLEGNGQAQTAPASAVQASTPSAKSALGAEERKKHCAIRVMECRGSGKTVKDWCKENGVGLTTFYRWQREAREDLLKIMEGLNRTLPCPEPQKPVEVLPIPSGLPVTAEVSEIHRQEPTLPAPVVPEGWAICEAAPPPAESGQGITIEIGKGRVTATADTDTDLLTKVCRILVAL